MDDIYNATNEQKQKWTTEALEIIGFEEMPAPGIYAKKHEDDKKILVDLNEKQPVAIFMIAGKRVAEDDEHGTLLIINQIIVDAEGGKMPTKSTPDEVVHVPTKDEPAPAHMSEVPNKDTEDIGAPLEPAPIDNPPATLMPPNVAVDIVRPVVSAAQAIAAWNEFQALQKAILEPSDFQKIGTKDYKKKSAWRKFAAFFNLNDKIVEETQTPHTDKQGWTWKIKVICTAPNGRFTEGVGMCSTSERNFAHLEHDTYATAHTRAKNRAISDMIAAGEVSAEEVST